jgi:hypoxanthine phosphoribosyltransferase
MKLCSEETLHKRITEMDRRSARIAGQTCTGLHPAGRYSSHDLMRQISVPNTVDFMAVSSYGHPPIYGHVRITLDLKEEIYNRNVLL